MIVALQAQINNTIETLLPIEENHWLIYNKCKDNLQHYETENKIWFNTQDWKEYIDYITDKLQL